MTVTFDIYSDYKTAFKDAVTRIVRQAIEDVTLKNEIVQTVTDAYVSAIGERPEIRELDDLASWLIFGTKGVSMRKKMEIKAQETLDRREMEVAAIG